MFNEQEANHAQRNSPGSTRLKTPGPHANPDWTWIENRIDTLSDAEAAECTEFMLRYFCEHGHEDVIMAYALGGQTPTDEQPGRVTQ